MKKVFLVFVSFFAITMAFGQSNVSSIDQNSESGAIQNKATVNQTGQGNDSDIDQLIKEGSADPDVGLNQTSVVQNGKDNTTEVYQEMKTHGGSPANMVNINQKGKENFVDVKSVSDWGHDVDVNQDGRLNEAYVDVERNGNKATINQINDNINGTATQIIKAADAVVKIDQLNGKNNTATQTIGVPEFIGDNDLYVKQLEGNGNIASQEVNGTGWDASGASGNKGRIYQNQGAGNQAHQLFDVIGDPANDPYGNYAQTTQTGGSGNYATSLQRHSNNEAYQTQENGSGNYAQIGQKLGWAGETTNSKATQYQTGQDNIATAGQFNGDNVGYQYQDGKRNKSTLKQTGGGNSSDMRQWGNDNYAASHAFNGSTVDMDQNGNENQATVLTKGDGNLAKVDQKGTGNTAGEEPYWEDEYGIFQEGDLNKAYVIQDGQLNTAQISQVGDSNWAHSTSTGSGHDSEIIQAGDSNWAKVVQGN